MTPVAAAVAGLVLAGAPGPAPLQPSAAIAASSYEHAAKPVALTYTLRYEMQCGSPGAGPLTLAFPAQAAVPSGVSASEVLLDGKPAPAVIRRGSSLVVTLPKQPAIMCDVIGMGTLTVAITKGAGFANPKTPGVYAYPVTSDKISAAPKLRIR